MPEPDGPDPATTCARPPDRPAVRGPPPLAPPLQLSSVYEVAGLDQIDALYEGREPGFIYARDGHPNAAQLAAKVAALEGAEAGLVCASGMAAEAAVFLACLGQGDEVALSEGLYGRTVALVGRELARFGVGHRRLRRDPARDPPRRAHARGPGWSSPRRSRTPCSAWPTSRAWPRSPGRPASPWSIDHTFAPLLCRPLELGADAVDALGDQADRRPQRPDARPARRPARR